MRRRLFERYAQTPPGFGYSLSLRRSRLRPSAPQGIRRKESQKHNAAAIIQMLQRYINMLKLGKTTIPEVTIVIFHRCFSHLGQRVESKDDRDIAALLRVRLSLDAGMAGAGALYGVSFSPMDCAKALVYFKGGDLALVPSTDRTTLMNAARALRMTSFAPAPLLSPSLIP